MKIAIITDSNSGITVEDAKKLGIYLAPTPFLINGEEFLEGINLTQPEFYEKLFQDAQVSTSQPNIFNLQELWKKLLKTYDEIVQIPISSALSAAYETESSAAKEFGDRIQVVDNHRVSVTQKSAVLEALKLAKEGKNAKQIKEYLEQTGGISSIYIMVTTLKYLRKGGRLTPAVAALGTLLKIKPILQIQGGKLDKFTQVISYAQGKKKMIEQLQKDIETRFKEYVEKGKFKVYIAYTYLSDKAFEFEKEVNEALEKYNLKVEYVDPLSLSVACHIGDGALAVACSIFD